MFRELVPVHNGGVRGGDFLENKWVPAAELPPELKPKSAMPQIGTWTPFGGIVAAFGCFWADRFRDKSVADRAL